MTATNQQVVDVGRDAAPDPTADGVVSHGEGALLGREKFRRVQVEKVEGRGDAHFAHQ